MEINQKTLLHYEVYHLAPEAKWVVFIHGAGGDSSSWKFQVDAFRPYFNLVFMDLRDHGRSKNLEPSYDTYNFDIVSGDVIRVLDHLGITRAHFVSLSLGSIILQKIHDKREEVIDRVVMAGGIFRATWKIKFFVYSGRFLSKVLSYRQVYNLFSLIILPRKNHRKSRRIFRLQSKRLTQQEFNKWLMLHREFFTLLRNYFNKNLEKLSLVVMGSEDHVFLKAAKNFVRHHQLAQIEILEKCGHVVTLEMPHQFNETALRFLLKP